MKIQLALSVVALALLAGRFSLSTHELTDADRARIETEVTAFLASYLEVLEAEDEDAIRALYVSDERFAWCSDGEVAYRSGDDVLAGLAAMEGMRFSTETTEVEVVPLTPDLAHARTAFRTKISQDEAVVYEFEGLITWLLEEQEDAAWQVLRGHTSTPKERR